MARQKQRMTIERGIAAIAGDMGIGYLCETWARANLRLDKFRRVEGVVRDTATDPQRLPCLLNVQNIEGSLVFSDTGLVRDEASLLLAFCDAMPLDFTGAQAERIAEGLKRLAARFVARMGESGLFEPLPESVSYRVTFDRLDACLCVCAVSLTVTELTGECF